MDNIDINWRAIESAEQIEHILTVHLGSRSPQDVYTFARQHGLECSEPVESVIYCSVPASGKWKLIRTKWLMEFHLNGNCIDQIKVSKGYIGP